MSHDLSAYQLQNYIIAGFGAKLGATLPQLIRYIRRQDATVTEDDVVMAIRIASARGLIKHDGNFYVATFVDPVPYVQVFFDLAREQLSLRELGSAYIRKRQLPRNYDIADDVKEDIMVLIVRGYLAIDQSGMISLGPRYIELVDRLLEYQQPY